jgi:hypothetical protein
MMFFCLAEPGTVDILVAVAINGYRQGWCNRTASHNVTVYKPFAFAFYFHNLLATWS